MCVCVVFWLYLSMYNEFLRRFCARNHVPDSSIYTENLTPSRSARGTPYRRRATRVVTYVHRVATCVTRLAVSTVFQFSNFTNNYEDNRWLGFIPP